MDLVDDVHKSKILFNEFIHESTTDVFQHLGAPIKDHDDFNSEESDETRSILPPGSKLTSGLNPIEKVTEDESDTDDDGEGETGSEPHTEH